MRIGILTGGGDCPGLNAVIRAAVRKGEGVYGDQLVGFRHGWRGVVEGEAVELTIA
jgi:6-phosphofructokinase 1